MSENQQEKLAGPCSSRPRWVESSAALTASALGAGIVQAGTVQITQVGNEITFAIGGQNLNPDLTGDGVDDLDGFTQRLLNTNDLSASVLVKYARGVFAQSSGGNRWGVLYSRLFSGTGTEYFIATTSGFNAFVTETFTSVVQTTAPFEFTRLFEVTFEDPRINGGQETNAFLEAFSQSNSNLDHLVRFTRLIFDDESTDLPIGVEKKDPPFPEWVDPTIAQRAAAAAVLQRQIAKQKKKLRKARKVRTEASRRKVQRIRKVIRRLNQQLRAL